MYEKGIDLELKELDINLDDIFYIQIPSEFPINIIEEFDLDPND